LTAVFRFGLARNYNAPIFAVIKNPLTPVKNSGRNDCAILLAALSCHFADAMAFQEARKR